MCASTDVGEYLSVYLYTHKCIGALNPEQRWRNPLGDTMRDRAWKPGSRYRIVSGGTLPVSMGTVMLSRGG